MQGIKIYQEKLFSNFQLSEIVPENNFYRQLKAILDLEFLRSRTKAFYGSSGQKSIDPVVFFKLCLIGYLENIISDRKLVEHCRVRLDLLYFLNYNIDEPLPWHSTISRTRQLFPTSIFEEVFTLVLQMCINKGMVSGHTQVIDSAPIKANASMDSLELKVPAQDLDAHLAEIRHISQRDKAAFRKAKMDKATREQKTISANQKQLKGIKSRNKKWSKDQDQRQGSNNKKSRYTSNKTHYSPTDPDARISVKPGKARKLNYSSQLSVDTAHHVITDIGAYHADKKENQCLQDITERLHQRLWSEGLLWENCIADTGYSSGEVYAYLEAKGLKSFIPPHGTYKGGPDNFLYHKEQDYYQCPQGKEIPFKKVFIETKNNTKKKEYRASSKLCADCPIKVTCLGKSKEKRITVTYYREEYERNNKRVHSKLGRYMKGKRQSTVEPVFGTLTQFMGLRKINTIGIAQANKVMHMSAVAYNLKKYLKFIHKKAKSGVQHHNYFLKLKTTLCRLIKQILSPCIFRIQFS
ncbi:IS1182 family transposase [Tenacibaculum agarivorans]|uniref:IS1182 family transposase n=1 Tax=Tenacibaculum agarivorans TaxID=1908389 RepID=UPI00094B7E9F|nr:IS1182 family transposase [Tenacibaculum agarivorans]